MPPKDPPDATRRTAWGGAAALAPQAASIAVYLDLIVRERALHWTVTSPTPFSLQHRAATSVLLLAASVIAAIIGLFTDPAASGPSWSWRW